MFYNNNDYWYAEAPSLFWLEIGQKCCPWAVANLIKEEGFSDGRVREKSRQPYAKFQSYFWEDINTRLEFPRRKQYLRKQKADS